MTWVSHSQPSRALPEQLAVLERMRDTTSLQRVALEDTLLVELCFLCKDISSPSETQRASKRMEEALVLLLSNSDVNDSIPGP